MIESVPPRRSAAATKSSLSVASVDRELLDDLVIANRTLANSGILGAGDASGPMTRYDPPTMPTKCQRWSNEAASIADQLANVATSLVIGERSTRLISQHFLERGITRRLSLP